MKTIQQVAAEVLIKNEYAITSDEHHLNLLVEDDISDHWEWNDFTQDTLEGHRQLGSLEDWYGMNTHEDRVRKIKEQLGEQQ